MGIAAKNRLEDKVKIWLWRRNKNHLQLCIEFRKEKSLIDFSFCLNVDLEKTRIEVVHEWRHAHLNIFITFSTVSQNFWTLLDVC